MILPPHTFTSSSVHAITHIVLSKQTQMSMHAAAWHKHRKNPRHHLFFPKAHLYNNAFVLFCFIHSCLYDHRIQPSWFAKQNLVSRTSHSFIWFNIGPNNYSYFKNINSMKRLICKLAYWSTFWMIFNTEIVLGEDHNWKWTLEFKCLGLRP